MKNPDKCYLSFSPWNTKANYSLTIRAIGDKPNDYNYHSVSDYKSISIIKRNIENLPNEITLNDETIVTTINEKYQLLDDYLKTFITKDEAEKLASAVKAIEDLKKGDPVVPTPEPIDPEPSDNKGKGCGCSKSSIIVIVTFVVLVTSTVMLYRKKQ